MLFDIMGAFMSLLSTYFFIRLNNKAWAVGIVATCVNGWLYWHKGIYADMGLEVCYFLSMCYGWYMWKYHYSVNTGSSRTILKRLSSVQWSVLALSLCIVFALIYTLLNTFTNSNVAFLDAITTSLSLAAQWLMCHKIILTWMLWLITDALYAFMYLSKHLPFHSGLMLIYTAMAITGYWFWSTEYNKAAMAKEAIEV